MGPCCVAMSVKRRHCLYGAAPTCLAIGATCTHYGGPLAEGLVVGDTVRCPWHHACFSLRTGAALRPPALNDLPCWRVEQRDGMAFVREELQRPAPPSRPAAGLPTSVVIVGGGAAGLAAAEALRAEGYAGAVTLMSADPSPPCDRPNLSKDYLAGTAEADWIPLRPPEFYPKHHIDLRLGARVTAIEPGAHAVLLADGSRMTYGALLLATGAEPIKLGIPGASLPHVHVLRTLADSNALIARADTAAALCGGGGEFHRPGGRRLATHPRAGGARGRARSASHGACHGRGNRRHGARDP